MTVFYSAYTYSNAKSENEVIKDDHYSIERNIQMERKNFIFIGTGKISTFLQLLVYSNMGNLIILSCWCTLNLKLVCQPVSTRNYK